MVVVGEQHYPQKTINLYGDFEKELWEALEAEIRENYSGDRPNEGEIAAQAFAEAVGKKGPLDGETA